MDASKSTMALAQFAANLDTAKLPAEVRQKLGWLLLDHLRVCSIGARLPWSDWSRRYVGLVGKAGTSHVLFSPDTVNPQHATFLNVTFGSSFDADDTHVGAMLHPGVAAWSAALPTEPGVDPVVRFQRRGELPLPPALVYSTASFIQNVTAKPAMVPLIPAMVRCGPNAAILIW